MKLLVALAFVVLVSANDDEGPSGPRLYVGMTKFFQGRDVFMFCGPCNDASDSDTITVSIARCTSKDSCTDFFKVERKKGENEAKIVVPNKLGSIEVRPSQVYIRYRKPGAECADEGLYRCQCRGENFYGNVNVMDGNAV